MDLETRTAAVLALLRAQSGLDVFDGEPKARVDSDGRAHPYAALYVSPGWHDPQHEDLAGGRDLLGWSFQVTAAGGDDARARRAVTRVLNALLGQRLDAASGPIGLAFDPGAVRVDRDATPARHYLPLSFTVDLAATPA